MSFERFLSSDVYVFEHVGGWIECCACDLNMFKDDSYVFKASTPREMIEHLRLHDLAGHDTGDAIPNIMQDYEDLDIVIQPYKREE